MNDFTSDLQLCIKTLADGGVILYPTDTVWGLGCDATNEAAVKKLISLKGKKGKNGLIILLASERDLLKYATGVDLAVFNFLQGTASPTTVIYDGGTGVADDVLSSDGSIAIRLVKDEFCRHLVKRFRKPVVSTSANIHGEPTPDFYGDINLNLINSVDYAVRYRQQDSHRRPPSTIIKWQKDGLPKILR